MHCYRPQHVQHGHAEMTREELQREEEREWVTRFFLHHFDQSPKFEPLPTNSRPDVCLRFNGKRVGIELTRAIDDSRARHDTFGKSFLKAASMRHAALKGLHGRVTVSFRHGFDPNTYHRRALGNELGQIVADQWTELAGVTVISSAALSPRLRELVTEVRAFVHEGATFADWTSAVAARVQPIDVQTLQPIINNKAKHLSDYRKMGCDEVWLLIYARLGRAAEIFDEVAGFDPSSLQSDFDRTFFYDVWRCHELAVDAIRHTSDD